MNRYDKDMMHNRELISDAKKQLHRADLRYKKGDEGAKQEMIHDRELIYDAGEEIHRIDDQKKDHSPFHMSDELTYGGPVIDQEPGALSHMGASRVLKHMKSRM